MLSWRLSGLRKINTHRCSRGTRDGTSILGAKTHPLGVVNERSPGGESAKAEGLFWPRVGGSSRRIPLRDILTGTFDMAFPPSLADVTATSPVAYAKYFLQRESYSKL